MAYLLYFLIALGATTAGSLTGIGGGVIIKPLMDLLGEYDVETIGVLSSATVFAMAIVSAGKHIAQKSKIDFAMAVPLALGSVAGGLAGQLLLQMIAGSASKSLVTIVQNGALAALILCVLVYMRVKSRIPSLNLRGLAPAVLTGAFLGLSSSFLGIGGGPINVALIIFLFGYDTKQAAVCSIITILFSQASKLLSVGLTEGLCRYDLSILPLMATGAVAGGLIGSSLNKRLPVQAVDRSFNAVQLLVLALSAINIASSIMAW